mgnify:CR=1 FL=1
MEAKIQYFQSPVFGQIRVTVIDDKPMFVANDVAAMLGYSNRYDAINRHCKGVVKHEGVSITTNQYGKSTEQKVEISFIPESDVYRLVMRSKLPEAEKFQDWVCEEILPAIRKTGGYMIAKEDETPEEIMISRENVIGMHERIKERLSKFEYQVLELYLKGYDYTQIAEKLGKQPKAIDNALQRIRSKVREVCS